MNPPNDYYPCFLGNGLDAVLIGPTGAMTQERAQGNLDRCYWYKSDRYYPEDRVVPTPSRLPREGQPLYLPGADWKELAPLARTWYEVRYDGLRLDVRESKQRFSPRNSTLYSEVDYGAVQAEVYTFMHAKQPLLATFFVFDKPVTFRAYMGAGVWLEEGYDANPFDSVSFGDDGAQATYKLGEVQGHIKLALDAIGDVVSGGDDNSRWLEVTTSKVVQYFSIVDDLDGPLDESGIEEAIKVGFDVLLERQWGTWGKYFIDTNIKIPDEQFQKFYDYSFYQFKASQNPISGGLPVNNLRLTWSSHVFWDAFYMDRALLEGNRKHEALEASRFFMRTLDHAKQHAREEFNTPGLKWDWEITHRGEHAYGTWLHQKEQMHNNASYANIIWGYYEFTQDRAYLAEFYPLLRGLAEFFLANVIEQTERGTEIRALVDVGEHVTPVKNEGFNLSGTIRILQLASRAANILGADADFASQCDATASELMKTLDRLFNGSFFDSAEGDHSVGFSSLAPIYPIQVIAPNDPRAISTAQFYREQFERKVEGRDEAIYSAWGTGVLATILAMQGDGDTAWEMIQGTKIAMCSFGGFSELVFPGNHWNMQYFSTAQAAVCTAIHNLLLQSRDGEISVFPALPSAWPSASFRRLLAQGIEVSASMDRASGIAQAELKNNTEQTLKATVRYGSNTTDVVLWPGKTEMLHWEIA